MKTAEEMYQYTRENKLGYNLNILGPWLQKKHFQVIEDALLDHEEVISAFVGRHRPEGGENRPNGDETDQTPHAKRHSVSYFGTEGFYGYAITTEQRIIYAHWSPFHHDATNIPLSNLNNVNPDTGFIWGAVKVETFGDSFSVFWTKSVVRKIAKLIQQGVSDSKDGYMDGVTNSMRTKNVNNGAPRDLYAELEQGKKALDNGLITQAEYDQLKQRLLNE
ncbi:SHOCT domain-containing protein [Periweissella cryptocerci]|uniref:SHOCT domain-containing protein n=1 Tax=Periweissella cryptocerci TaxID=2506420 RepID=A0A4P6YU97_9LACO|nr:SHOCT domain-containing protein [Periweissella cryptocerci]QBO36273.1 SHOCT domain-containing protein [Periweissella cryptocerci]